MSAKPGPPETEASKLTIRTIPGSMARWMIFLVAWILITVAGLTPRPHLEKLDDIQVGEPSPRTVIAPFTYKIEDQGETERLRSEAEKTVPRTFQRIGGVVEGANDKWRALMEIAQFRSNGLWPNEDQISEASQAAKTFWLGLTKEQQNLLSQMAKDPAWAEAVKIRLIRSLMEDDILLSQEELRMLQPAGAGAAPVPWNLKKLDGTLEYNASGSAVLSVTTAQRIVSGNLSKLNFENNPVAEKLSDELARAFIQPTLRLDQVRTRDDRLAARALIPSVSITVKQNQNIVRKGEEVSRDEYAALLELSTKKQSRLGEVTGRGLLLALVLGLFFGFLKRFEKNLYQDLPRMATLFGLTALIVWIGFATAWVTENYVGTGVPVEYVVPVAAIGILVTFLENSRLGIFSVVLATLLLGAQFHWDFSSLLLIGVTGVLAAYQVSGVDRRSQIYMACPWIFGPGLLMAIANHLIENPSYVAFAGNISPLLWGALCLFINGILSVMLVFLLLPLLEDLLGVTTEFKLREISIYHPLLRQLEEKAPGTYYHSLNVSALAESAAAAIGANQLLVKVAAYYHDIGKMEKPSYFAENQFTEEDKKKHSRISPQMSCLIIRNHVKLGLELAKEHKLPEALLPFIAEHHGTTLLSYFYDEARKDDPHGTITQEDFRYAGPKPQTIESAILMIADTLEAASRSMNLVGENQIRLFVKRMINDKTLDGQFDECNLTFKELGIMTESFTRTLKTMMHRRIAYPSNPEVEIAGQAKKPDGSGKVQRLFGRGGGI